MRLLRRTRHILEHWRLCRLRMVRYGVQSRRHAMDLRHDEETLCKLYPQMRCAHEWGAYKMTVLNIIDHRKRPYRFLKINAVIEPTRHDNRCTDADQAGGKDAWMGYDEREHIW